MKLRAVYIAFLLSAVALQAKDREPAGNPFVLNRHEFALSGAFFPGRYAFGYDFNFIPMYADGHYEGLSSIYADAAVYSEERVTNSWTAAYTFNITKIFALSASLTYEGGWSDKYRREDNVHVARLSSHYLTPMLTARFSWLNRRIVRLYSSFGMGVAVNLTDTEMISADRSWTRPRTYVSVQAAPVGISVGGKLFGFAEVGIGTIYMGGCMGLGYRF